VDGDAGVGDARDVGFGWLPRSWGFFRGTSGIFAREFGLADCGGGCGAFARAGAGFVLRAGMGTACWAVGAVGTTDGYHKAAT